MILSYVLEVESPVIFKLFNILLTFFVIFRTDFKKSNLSSSTIINSFSRFDARYRYFLIFRNILFPILLASTRSFINYIFLRKTSLRKRRFSGLIFYSCILNDLFCLLKIFCMVNVRSISTIFSRLKGEKIELIYCGWDGGNGVARFRFI